MSTRVLTAAVWLGIMAQAAHSQAAEQATPPTTEEAALLQSQIDALRSVSATERKILIIRELNMTPGEAEAFWPLYEEYHAEMTAIDTQRENLVTEYASYYTRMTDEIADDLLDRAVDYTEKKQKLKKRYIKKFREILPGSKVARYFQLENKLDAVVDYQLAARIPLVH